ncbi:MAG TPA: AAA family ATPase [Polyangiaceae bacterium]|nr:AAA family ATPase [Polyangiaceae bacterium]
MKRRFNTAGPCIEAMHYMIPAERRLPEAAGLVEQMGYFVVHAPRQTGKTTALRALAERLTASGRYAALHASCEAGEATGEDYAEAQRAVLTELGLRADSALPPELRPPPWPGATDASLLRAALSAWAQACPRPLALFLDEIDALRGQSLVSVLRQLRAGFAERPRAFPWSVVLCGLRDVRDYKAASGGDPGRLGTSSPFNIKVESLRLGDFSADEVRELYGQHTADTGQAFTEGALARAFELTAGQPWLVNALAREVVEKMAVPPAEPVTAEHLERAKERLILARATHLDSLLVRLTEPRVKRVLAPIISGGLSPADDLDDDIKYLRDLGLVAANKPLRVANPIYREVIVRVLAGGVEEYVTAEPARFVLPDGRLAFRKLLRAFAAFWREHGEVLAAGVAYHEAAPQLVLMAFLQRIVNGGGAIDREYGVGRGRIDLLVRWPYRLADGRAAVQRRALELKVWREGEKDPLPKGLEQLDGYLARLGLKRGVLVVFDRRKRGRAGAPRFVDTKTRSGRAVRLLRALVGQAGLVRPHAAFFRGGLPRSASLPKPRLRPYQSGLAHALECRAQRPLGARAKPILAATAGLCWRLCAGVPPRRAPPGRHDNVCARRRDAGAVVPLVGHEKYGIALVKGETRR